MLEAYGRGGTSLEVLSRCYTGELRCGSPHIFISFRWLSGTGSRRRHGSERQIANFAERIRNEVALRSDVTLDELVHRDRVGLTYGRTDRRSR